MSFREVQVFEIREVLRLWLWAEGLRFPVPDALRRPHCSHSSTASTVPS